MEFVSGVIRNCYDPKNLNISMKIKNLIEPIIHDKHKLCVYLLKYGVHRYWSCGIALEVIFL